VTGNLDRAVRVTVDESRCVGCMLCVLECSFHNFGQFQPSQASLALGDRHAHVTEFESERMPNLDETVTDCSSCHENPPPCVRVCPTGAIAFADKEAPLC